MKREKITVELVKDAFENISAGEEFTCSEIKSIVTALYGNMEVIPSDYCYNRTNKGIDIEKNLKEQHCFFEYVGHNRYKYIGAGKLYSGNLFHKAKGRTESIVGKINNNEIEWYE